MNEKTCYRFFTESMYVLNLYYMFFLLNSKVQRSTCCLLLYVNQKIILYSFIFDAFKEFLRKICFSV